MSWPWRLVYDFWTKPVRAEPLALFRILLGVTFLLSLLVGLAPDLPRFLELCPPEPLDKWLGSDGRWSLFRASAHFPERTEEEGPPIPPDVAARWNSWGARHSSVYLGFAALILAVAGMTIGWHTRLCTIIALVLTISLHNRFLWTLNGGDDMFRTALFYLMLAPAGVVWSVDHWKRSDRSNPAPVYIPPWSVRLIQIQLCAVYFFTGLAKLDFGDPTLGDWVSGEALYWALNDLSLMRWPYHWVQVPLWLCRFASWGTICWEIGFPLLVAIRWLRPWALLAGVGLHVGILVAMEVGWFSQVTLCWYAVFLSGEVVERSVCWWKRQPPQTWAPREAVTEKVA
jgi:hypothetical protein